MHTHYYGQFQHKQGIVLNGSTPNIGVPNVGVKNIGVDKRRSPKRRCGTNAGVGQTSEWTHAGFLGQKSEWTNAGVPKFFSILKFKKKNF